MAWRCISVLTLAWMLGLAGCGDDSDSSYDANSNNFGGLDDDSGTPAPASSINAQLVGGWAWTEVGGDWKIEREMLIAADGSVQYAERTHRMDPMNLGGTGQIVAGPWERATGQITDCTDSRFHLTWHGMGTIRVFYSIFMHTDGIVRLKYQPQGQPPLHFGKVQ